MNLVEDGAGTGAVSRAFEFGCLFANIQGNSNQYDDRNCLDFAPILIRHTGFFLSYKQTNLLSLIQV